MSEPEVFGRIRDEMSGTRQRMREQLREGRLDDRMVELDVQEKAFPSIELITGSSMEEVGVNLRDMMPGLFQGRSKRRRVNVAELVGHKLGHDRLDDIIGL